MFVSLYVEFYFVCTLDIILKQQLFAFLIAQLMLFALLTMHVCVVLFVSTSVNIYICYK